MKCPKCLSKHIWIWKDKFTCKCGHTWTADNKNIMQKASGVKPEDLPDIVVAQPMTTYPIVDTAPKKKPVSTWACLACGSSNLENEYQSNIITCADCSAEMTFSDLHDYYSKHKNPPPVANAKFWRDDLLTDQTSFKFTIETRLVPHKWVPKQGIIGESSKEGKWVAIQDEAFYSEPEDYEFAISSHLFHGDARQIEDGLWYFLQSTYKNAAHKTWRKPVEYMLERFITPAIERYLSSKDWTKVPPVDEAWVNELDPTNQGETK